MRKLSLWQYVALASCLAGVCLWIALAFQAPETGPRAIAILMLAILLGAAVATLIPVLPAMAAFAFALIPGLYTLGWKNWPVFIGVSNLAFIVATIQMHRLKEPPPNKWVLLTAKLAVVVVAAYFLYISLQWLFLGHPFGLAMALSACALIAGALVKP